MQQAFQRRTILRQCGLLVRMTPPAYHPCATRHYIAHRPARGSKNCRVEQCVTLVLGQRNIVTVQHQQIGVTLRGDGAGALP